MADERIPQEEAEIIYIPDDEGNEEAFEVIMRFELDDGTDRKYLMVVPAEEDTDEEQEVFAFRYEEENDEIQLFPIEEQEEWDIVEETFNTLMSEFGEAEEDAQGKS
ncbi:DUF1292 domain-containing protein [Cohnella sp. CFH 77786]|uniref:DUF1292 domain-containing protein n=1 Tax=Cohnella sp. CFH 77786 TaxID=2662265 RepID=UPI001C60C912|nr:DUF1292 domain-containing protein [Cohnella sp. CFH 77786]MBW5444990.1 DUF1292 domain-containing protein [Cohnella sp. CFH 77786]